MAKAETPETPEVETPEVEAAEPAVAAAGDPNFVSYRVLKAGDGKIHTGRFNTELGQDETYAKGEFVENVARGIAEGLEERHYVEILED